MFKIFKKKKKLIKEIATEFTFDEVILNELKSPDLSEFGITNDWESISLEFYLKYINYITASKFDKDITPEERGLRMLAFLEGITYDEMKSKPNFLINTIDEKWKFLGQGFTNLNMNEPFIDIQGKIYFIQKNFELLSFEQYQNQTEYLKESEEDNNYTKNIHILLAICCIPREEYKLENAIILSEKILKSDMYNLIPAISFFLSKDNSYMTDIHTCLKGIQEKKMKELEAIMTKLEISIKHGVGTQRFTIWQMKMLRNLLKFYRFHYKRYSSI